jgi:ketosteroid isomerase-like protein
MAHKKFDTPEAAEAAFYQAFAAIDLDLMATVWADDDKILCIHPGRGILQGRSAVMRSWMEIFAGSVPPLIEYRLINGFGTEDLAVHLVEERIRPRGKPPEAANRVLATNVYLSGGGSWRLAEHHASLPLMDWGNATGDERQLH